MPRPPVIKPEGAEFEAWMAKEHPDVDYDKTYATMRLHIRDQWKEYQRQMQLKKVRDQRNMAAMGGRMNYAMG